MEVHVGDRAQPDKPSKTEVLFVAAAPPTYDDRITCDDTDLSDIELGNGNFLPVFDKFCYLGTILSRDFNDTEDVVIRVKKASNAFGSLKNIVTGKHISLAAKSAIYSSFVLPVLLYGSESWCLKEQLINQLRVFHHRCVRTICKVNLKSSFTQRIRTETLLERLRLSPIDTYLVQRQLSWLGHVARMPMDRLPRRMLSSWVVNKRPRGSPQFTYGRGIYKALKKVDIPRSC